jgi:phage shock protein E
MKWAILLIIAAVFVVFLKLRASAALPPAIAREYLRKGALLVDVRTANEFAARHLPDAVNIPLDDIKEALPRRVPDKGKVLLLHCHSGRRSAIAERQLRGLGYTNAFNLGSYEQAGNIVRGGTR